MRVLRARRWKSLPVVAILAARPLVAQTADYVCHHAELRTGLLVRVRAYEPDDTTRGSVVGPMVRCAEGYLVLGRYPGQDDAAYRVPTHSIHRLWVRDNARLVGLVSGIVLGAGAGGGIAAARTEICFRGTPPAYSTCHGPIVADALIGGAVGGLVGWVLGRGLPHWRRIIP
jgi:hypothetical protein